jgi:hypothetical protein
VRPDPSLPIDLADLAYGEHLIVWAFRAFAKGRGRPIVPAPPGGLTLTRDERTLLNLFAAAQAGDGAGFTAQFRALTGSASNPVVERAVTLVAEAMARRGHRLGVLEDGAPWDFGEGASRLIA